MSPDGANPPRFQRVTVGLTWWARSNAPTLASMPSFDRPSLMHQAIILMSTVAWAEAAVDSAADSPETYYSYDTFGVHLIVSA